MAFVTFGVKFGLGFAAMRSTAGAMPRSTIVTFVSAAATGTEVATTGLFAAVELEDTKEEVTDPGEDAGIAATCWTKPKSPAAAIDKCIYH